MDAALVLPAQLRRHGVAAEHRVDRVRDVRMDHDPFAVLDLHDHVERRRRLPLQDALLGPAAACLLVAERDALDPADQVGQRRVQHQVVEVVAVGRPDELHAAFGDGAGGDRLQLRPDLVDHDDLGHVVLHRLDHHLVLERRRPDLHPAGLADRRVRDVAVARDLVRRVDDHDALAQVVGKDARRLPQHRRLADARPAHDQDRLSGLDEVADDLDRAVDRPPDATRQAHDLAAPVPDRADPVEGPLDAGPVVVAERPDLVDNQRDVGLGDLAVREDDLAIGKARFRDAAQVQHDLDERGPVGQRMDRRHDLRGQRTEQRVEVVDQLAGRMVGHTLPFSGLPARGPARRRGRASPSSGA